MGGMRQLSTKLPVLIILSTGIFGLIVTSVICGIGGETAQQWAPIPQATAQIALDRRSQEAQVTATYIAVLSSEVVSDTHTTHTLGRAAQVEQHGRAMAFERVANGGKMVLAIVVTLSLSIASVGVGFGIARRATTVRLKDGPHLSLSGNWFDTRTGLVSGTKREQLTVEHALALLEYRSVMARAFVEAFAEAGGVKLLTREN